MSANDIFMGTSVPSAKFKNPGDSVRGTVCREPISQQAREYDADNPGGGELAFWKKSGQPIMQAVIDVQTDQRDPLVEGDSGIRRVYVKDHGGKYEKGSGRIRDAFRDAVTAAGARGIEVGGYLEVTYTGPGVGKGAIPPKLFRVTYRPPQPGQADQQVVGAQPEQSQYVPQQQPQTFAAGGYVPQQAQTYTTSANSILGAMQANHQGGQQPAAPPF